MLAAFLTALAAFFVAIAYQEGASIENEAKNEKTRV